MSRPIVCSHCQWLNSQCNYFSYTPQFKHKSHSSFVEEHAAFTPLNIAPYQLFTQQWCPWKCDMSCCAVYWPLRTCPVASMLCRDRVPKGAHLEKSAHATVIIGNVVTAHKQFFLRWPPASRYIKKSENMKLSNMTIDCVDMYLQVC